MKERDHIGELGIHGRIRLKRTSQKNILRVWAVFHSFRIGLAVDYCKQGNKHSRFPYMAGNFLTGWANISSWRKTGWRWRQHGPLKRWYPTTTQHGVTTQKTSTWTSHFMMWESTVKFRTFLLRYVFKGIMKDVKERWSVIWHTTPSCSQTWGTNKLHI
jgi:hypothetical protein